MLFTTIETLALAARAAVSLDVFEQPLAESGMGPPHCPRCDIEGQRIKQRERRLQTRRGVKVPLSEQECYYPGCRRALLPLSPNRWGSYVYAAAMAGEALEEGRQAYRTPPTARPLLAIALRAAQNTNVRGGRLRHSAQRLCRQRMAKSDSLIIESTNLSS